MIARSLRLPGLLAALLFLGCGAMATYGRSAETAAKDAPTPIQFRRVFAPEDRVKDWPVGDGRYLPMDAAEFDRLTAGTPSNTLSASAVPAVTIRTARYEARLAEHGLVGQASLDVALSGAGPAMLSLEPCSLALGRITWDATDAKTEQDDGNRVLQGLGGDGVCQAIVDHPGRLRFDWSLAGRRDSADVLGFLFEIPDAPSNELLLDLPKGVAPSPSHGVVLGSEPVGDTIRRWRIALGGHDRFRVRILPEGVAGHRSQLALLREARTYDFSLRGVEMSALWKLQVHNEPLSQVTLLLDPGLELASARCGDALLSWTNAPLPDGQGTRVVLTLNEPIQDTERVIRLSALGPPTLGRTWRLPRIRPEGLFWQEGSIAILVPEPLVADRLVPLGCGQTATGLLSPPRMGESLQFQAFEPEATVELSLSRRPPRLQIVSGTALELAAEEATARIAADFRLIEGARFAVEADVAPHWTIQTIDSTPANAVSDWTLEPGPDGRQTLAIRLANGLSPTNPLRLVMTARHGGSTLRAADLPPVRFRNAAETKRLVAVRPSGSCSLNLTGDERLMRLSVDKLAPAELELFADAPRDLLFESDSRADRLVVALLGQKAKYGGAIRIDATIGNGKLRETCLLQCIPRLGRVDRVLVQFYPRRDAAPQWTLGGSDEPILARRWSEDEQAKAGWDASLETWELTLRRPQNVPFEITAVRETQLSSTVKPRPAGTVEQTSEATTDARDASDALSLVAMPEATAQRGVLSVRVTDSEPLRIENRRLAPLPPEPAPADRVQTVRAAYRYNPAQDIAQGAAAAVRIGRWSSSAALSTTDAWACRSHLESRYQANGDAQHQATYELENSGYKSLRLVLPPSVAREDIRGVWIDGELAEWTYSAVDKADFVTVKLPANHKTPRLVIQWTAAGPPLRILGRLAAPLPEPDLPVFVRRWTVWLPPGYGGLGACASSSLSDDTTASWRGRLFGPLGRAEGVDRFDPLSLADWMAPAAEVRATESPAADETQGWSVVQMDLDADASASLTFVYRPSIRMFGVITFLLVASAGCWKAGRRPVLLVALFGGFGAAAMGLPVGLTPIASGGALGALFCLIWGWLHPLALLSVAEQPTVVAPIAVSTPGSTVSRIGPLGLVLLALFLSVRSAQAQTSSVTEASPLSPPAAAAPVYRVLVPIDAKKNPTGGKVFVPEKLYQDLYRRAETPAPKQQGWLIARARYQGVLALENGSGRLSVDALRARYNLHVFGRATRVQIPLWAEGANLLPDSMSLDGRPIDPQWDPDAAALAFDVAEPGDYRLEIALRPTVRTNGGSSGFDVVIPRVPRARLELTLPNEAPSIDVPSANGTTVLEKTPPRLLADLGPTDHLTVHWREGTASGASGPAIDAEQLFWMRLQPGSIVIAAKFKLRVVEGQVQHIQLAIDPRLRLLPLSGDDAPTVQVGHESGQSRLVAFHWSHPIPEQTTLEATFLLNGATGVGNFRLPRIELLDARPIKRWMAVTVDPALDREEQQRQSLESVSTADFLKAWTDGERKDRSLLTLLTLPVAKSKPSDAPMAVPQVAYRLPAGPTDWTISTRPHEPSTVVEQSLTLSCDDGRTDVLFEAQMSTASGYLFQHRVTAPRDLQIESVSLLEGNVERVSRWSREADGAVAVFLNAAASGQQKLTIRGTLPIPMDRDWALPQIRLDRCELRTTTVRVFRRPSVLVTVQGNQQFAGVSPPLTDLANAGHGRFVTAFSSYGLVPLPVTVAVRSNRPTVAPIPPAPAADSKKPVKSVASDDKPADAAQQSGVVRLSDVTIAWRGDGAMGGVAVFDLEPRGARQCPLACPPGCKLVRVLVEGMRVQPIAADGDRWSIPLCSQRLPQRVEVVFYGTCQNGRQTILETPAVGDWPVQQTLWTVAGPADWPAGEPDETPAVDAWSQELVRVKTTAAAIDSAAAISFDDPDETPRWHQAWARRLAASCRALRRELASAELTRDVADAKAELDAIETRLARLISRVGLKTDSGDQGDTVGLADGSTAASLLLADMDQPIVRCVLEGRADALTLDCRLLDRDPWANRLWMAAILLALTALAAAAVAHRWFAQFLGRWPCIIGAALGFVWWLWLTPSVLGLAVSLACLLAAGRKLIQKRNRTVTVG